ncbi:FYVE-domain-containing protein [Basidiobolus meristosporus CBS 931.73]|uniref:FYVE-domain-containing protein n=1 Tax=Basidiobolus meristosporus CBS 931.73 TaxID=1314790 RepID=A0A1Y1X611_9FUNG|nr:FYVE-domain-containing protein [Basidiobolus meristosporus CBS 931.73]|eukprot:ORX80816.1 FYVE-domain-containing protein [Basidiobolus meristosporus CBS 931.73]
MDVYALTRKKRPTNPTMGSAPSTPPSSVSQALPPPSSLPPQIRTAMNPSFQRQIKKAAYTSAQAAKLTATGPPTRGHWKSDDDVIFCTSCKMQFSFFERRHHCRRCGNIFCAKCSSKFIRLDQNAEFNPSGTLCRACDHCYEASVNLKRPSLQQEAIEAQSESPTHAASSANTSRIDINNLTRPTDPFIQPIPSVPRDWSWSTF